ncbi:MAG: diheme cytochrome c-553 [Thermoanaerobaculia bacterium]
MSFSGVVVWVIAAGSLAPLLAQGEAPPLPPPLSEAALAAATSRANPVARGEFLVRMGSCNDCHTPTKMGPNGPETDYSRLLSGHPEAAGVPPYVQFPEGSPWMAAFSGTFTAISGPWGISFTRNLTPDKETGLGSWTADEFVATIKSGRKQGRGRELLPPMPWPQCMALSEEDLRAIFAYLQSIPAIKNKVPDPVPPPAPPAAPAH